MDEEDEDDEDEEEDGAGDGTRGLGVFRTSSALPDEDCGLFEDSLTPITRTEAR